MQPSSKPSYGVSSLRAHRTLLSRTCAWTLRSDSTTSPSKATSGQSGQQARGRSRSALPARRNQRVSGSCSFWNTRRPMEDHAVHVAAVAGAVEGAAPASSKSATRIRARSASACGRRARCGAGGHVDLPARTGAVQVDVGVTGRHRGLGGAPSRADRCRAGWRGLPGGRPSAGRWERTCAAAATRAATAGPPLSATQWPRACAAGWSWPTRTRVTSHSGPRRSTWWSAAWRSATSGTPPGGPGAARGGAGAAARRPAAHR